MDTSLQRRPSELLKRGYSDEEIAHIYELGRLCLENGDLRRAKVIFIGICEVAPDFPPAWLGMSYLQIQEKKYDQAISSAEQALRLDPDFSEALLYLISCLMIIEDYPSAGTYLGEIGEKISSGMVDHPNVIRFFRAQLARYQNRMKSG